MIRGRMIRDGIHRCSTRHLTALIVVGIALSLAAPRFAAAQRPGMGARGALANNPGVRLWNELDQRFEEFAEELVLAEPQVQSVNVLVGNFREENRSALKRYDEVMTQMRIRMRGGARGRAARGGGARPDRQGMRPSGGGFAEIDQELVPAFEGLHADITELLDEEQVEKMKELLARRVPGTSAEGAGESADEAPALPRLIRPTPHPPTSRSPDRAS